MLKNLGSPNLSSKTWMAMWDIVLYNNSLQSSINAWYLHEWSWGEMDGWHLFSRTVLKRRSRSKFASHYTWGTNEVCEWKMDVTSTWLPTWHWMDHVSWSLGYFWKSPLRGRSNTKLGEHGIRNAHNCGFILFYHVQGSAWIQNSLKQHLVEGMVTYDFTLHLRVRDHIAWFWRCLGMTFGHFLLGSHNFMVTAFGMCVKWPLAHQGNRIVQFKLFLSKGRQISTLLYHGCWFGKSYEENNWFSVAHIIYCRLAPMKWNWY